MIEDILKLVVTDPDGMYVKHIEDEIWVILTEIANKLQPIEDEIHEINQLDIPDPERRLKIGRLLRDKL